MLLVWLSFSCEHRSKNGVIETRDEKIYGMLFNNDSIKKQLITLFDINDKKKPKVFKVLIARHNSYVRVTIYQLFYEFEKEDLPVGIIGYKNNIFLYYNGEELIFDNHINKEELKRRLSTAAILLEEPSGVIKDSRVLQFDIDLENKVKLNSSPITPFDERNDYIKFKDK